MHLPKQHPQFQHFIRTDLIVLALIGIICFGFIQFVTVSNQPFVSDSVIHTEILYLPDYALLSFTRNMLALIISFGLAVILGTIAANSKRVEKILVPILDVLQSLPVIAFLPGLVLALISIFEGSRWGLEIACLLTIVTGQLWNLVFAYYESQLTRPKELLELAQISQMSKYQQFFKLDLPHSYKSMTYNGMLSMAGGWFFLTTCEAFTLGNRDFRLPGLGSFISQTFQSQEYFSFALGILTIFGIIIFTDIFLWRPLMTWVNTLYGTTGTENTTQISTNWVLEIFKKTQIFDYFKKFFHTIFFFSPLAKKGYTKILFLQLLEKGENIITPSYQHTKEQVIRLKRSALYNWLGTFALGGIVFTLIPYLPQFGSQIAEISREEWIILMQAVSTTALRVATVLAFTSLWAVPLGIWIGRNKKIEKYFEPIIQNLAAFPAPVLFPFLGLFLYRLNIDPEIITLFLMSMGCQWYVLFNVIGGASQMNRDLSLVCRIYKLGVWGKFRLFYLPSIWPSLLTGLITGAGGAWNSSIIAEIISLNSGKIYVHGIGSQLTQASESGDYTRLVAGIFCMVLMLILLNRTVWRSLYLYVQKVKD